MKKIRVVTLGLVAAVAVLTWALPALSHPSRTAATTVTATAGKPSEFRFIVKPASAPAPGTVTFKVTNKGTIPHDFKINGKGTPLLSPGKSSTIKVTFKKGGNYAYLCTVAGHAAAGMKGVFKVK